MERFELVSEFQPTGDQPEAINNLVKGFEEGKKQQTLLGVTGSGKTSLLLFWHIIRHWRRSFIVNSRHFFLIML